MSLEILYEDSDLVAVSKPSGQVVIPGRGDVPGTPLVQELEKHMGRKLFVVHRLDRGASGIVLFAKQAAAHRHVSLQFEKRLVGKTYHVLVQGLVKTDGTVDQPLRTFGSGRMGVHPEGKAATTAFSVRQRFASATLLDVSPTTGRRHQIRVHLYSIGHPVMGDDRYGTDRPVGGVSRLMLHAWAIAFETPKGPRLRLEAPRPQDFQNVLDRMNQLQSSE